MGDKGRSSVDKNQFHSRAEILYDAWENCSYNLGDVQSLMTVVGNSDNIYTKSSAFNTWMFGYEAIDTLVIFTKNQIYILGTNRKADYFSPVVSESSHGKVPPVKLIYRNKADKDASNFERIIGYVKECGDSIGAFTKDKFESEFITSWNEELERNSIAKVDMTSTFAHIFAVKDVKELELVKKSAAVTVNTWTAARTKFVDIIDQERRVRHSALASDFEALMKDSKVQGLLAKHAIETSYDPIVMSGGEYSFKWNHTSTEAHLHSQFGTIITSFGARFENYCSNITRTMLIFPSSELEAAYEKILAVEQAVIAALKPGVKLSDVYKLGVNQLEKSDKKLSEHLHKKDLGFATGIEFRENRIVISAKCDEVVKAGMTFIVYVGVDEIPNKSASGEKGKPVAIAISDTIVVKEDGNNEILTEKAKSRLKSNVIRIKEGQNSPNEKENTNSKSAYGRGQRSVVLNDQTRNKISNEDKRKERQKELGVRLNEAARERMENKGNSSNDKRTKKSNVSYKNYDKFPQDKELSDLLIHVDRKHDSVILPIFGIPVPFHISMIKNCSQVVENDFTYLRINFNIPGSQIAKENPQFPHPLAHFMKELTFRASNLKEHGEMSAPSANLNTSYRLIKEIQKRFRTEEAEEKEKEGAIKQDKLVLSQNKLNPKLKDLLIRPNIIQKRITGSLEAHTNGFRYTSLRGDRIDVLYNNIKHAFFQPCDKEMIILLHFHLKYPVMWGKKKYSDVQFYSEVGEITTDLGKYHHMQDRDDIQSEQMERELRRKLNATFNGFCEKVARLTNDQFDFDSPFDDLKFLGVPYRSAVNLVPTSSCLVNLTEWPPFIVTLSEVELFHFERVSMQLKNFDMVIIYKDYNKKVQMVQQIPMQTIDTIKEWLNSCDIKYNEGIQSLNWAKIMKTINDDPTDFFNEGGWNFLDLESDAEDAEDESDESEAYHESDSGDDEDESDEDESEGLETSDSGSGDGSLDSDESEGKEWSDLEEEAEKDDRRKEVEDRFAGNDRDRDRKRNQGSRGGPPSKKRR